MALHTCRPLLTRGGEVHITLKLQPPYSSWGIPALALEQDYVHYSTSDFDLAAFPGYTHKTTEKDAVELDTGSGDAKRAIKTLVFRRIAGQLGMVPLRAAPFWSRRMIRAPRAPLQLWEHVSPLWLVQAAASDGLQYLHASVVGHGLVCPGEPGRPPGTVDGVCVIDTSVAT